MTQSLPNDIEIEVLPQTPEELATVQIIPSATLAAEVSNNLAQRKNKLPESSAVTPPDSVEFGSQPPSAVYVSVRNQLKTANTTLVTQTHPPITDSNTQSAFKSPPIGPSSHNIVSQKPPRDLTNSQSKSGRVRQNSNSTPTVEDIQRDLREKKRNQNQSSSLPNRSQTSTSARHQHPNTGQTHQSIQTSYSNHPMRSESVGHDADVSEAATDEQTDNDISDIQQHERCTSLPLSVNMNHTRHLVDMSTSCKYTKP